MSDEWWFFTQVSTDPDRFRCDLCHTGPMKYGALNSHKYGRKHTSKYSKSPWGESHKRGYVCCYACGTGPMNANAKRMHETGFKHLRNMERRREEDEEEQQQRYYSYSSSSSAASSYSYHHSSYYGSSVPSSGTVYYSSSGTATTRRRRPRPPQRIDGRRIPYGQRPERGALNDFLAMCRHPLPEAPLRSDLQLLLPSDYASRQQQLQARGAIDHVIRDGLLTHFGLAIDTKNTTNDAAPTTTHTAGEATTSTVNTVTTRHAAAEQAIDAAVPQERHRAAVARTASVPLSSSPDVQRDVLHLYLHAEEAAQNLGVIQFNRIGVLKVHDTTSMHQFKMEVPGVAEGRPSVLRGDRMAICHYDSETREIDTAPEKTYGSFVYYVNLDEVIFSMPREFNYAWALPSKFAVAFQLSRSQVRQQHRALNVCPPTALLTEATATQPATTAPAAAHHPRESPGYQRLNEEQRRFVSDVLSPARRLSALWGPPGTGKTTTVVAAVEQVLLTDPSARILVVAPSNEAADLLVERLVKQPALMASLGVESTQLMLRLHAFSRDPKVIPPLVLTHTYQQSPKYFPALTELLSRYRVVSTTIMTSDRLFAIGIPPDHFTHLFVDEAGHATEPLLVCALNVAQEARKVVLVGDPKQLGPRVESAPLIDVGLSQSPLARIMMTTASDTTATATSGQPRSVWDLCGTDLLQSYRSHPSIVHLVNEYYEDRLVPPANQATNTFASLWDTPLVQEWRRLHREQEQQRQQQQQQPAQQQEARQEQQQPPQTHPILCLTHAHPDSREKDSPSWMNQFEAHSVTSLVFTLKDHGLVNTYNDIAVITPYRKQAQKIRDVIYGRMMRERADRNELVQVDPTAPRLTIPLRVATVDSFQGREARVVIVSCVRSRFMPTFTANLPNDDPRRDAAFSIGFLRQPERTNVALSRAQQLLIIIGNRTVLEHGDVNGTWQGYFRRMDAMGEEVVMDVGGPLANDVGNDDGRDAYAARRRREEQSSDDDDEANDDHVTAVIDDAFGSGPPRELH